MGTNRTGAAAADDSLEALGAETIRGMRPVGAPFQGAMRLWSCGALAHFMGTAVTAGARQGTGGVVTGCS